MFGYFFEYHFSGQHLFYRLGVKISYWLNAWLKIEPTWLVINKLRFAFNKSGSFHYSVFFVQLFIWLEITAGWILFFEQLVIIQESMQISLCINQGLKDCTVITIAHRIKTIINYDRILVLNNGEIVEYDSPKNLLEKKPF